MDDVGPAAMSTGDSAPAPALPAASPPSGAFRRALGRCCLAAFAVGGLVTLLCLLLPLNTSSPSAAYGVLAAVVFFSRVYLLPAAAGWVGVGVVSLVCRRRALAAACGVLAVGWAAPEVWLAWPRTPAVTGPTFFVAQGNLNKDLRDATWAARVLLAMNADVVACQEVSPRSAEQLRAAFVGVYPYALVYPDAGYDGMAIFSKTPLTLVHAPESHERRDLTAVVPVLGRDLVLTDTHLSPPQLARGRRSNRWQVSVIHEQLDADPRPMIYAGDFNFTAVTPQACALRRLGLTDARLWAGHGREATWPAPSEHSWLPPVRIDTAYARGPLRAVATDVGSDIGSDHLPIKTTWQWTDASGR